MRKWLCFLVFFILFFSSASLVSAEKDEFRDISNEYWAADQIYSLFYRGGVRGYEDGTFRPSEPLTKAQFVTMLMNVTPTHYQDVAIPFDDVPFSHWAYSSIQRAFTIGLLPNETDAFHPNKEITRNEAAVYIAKILMLDGIETPLFTDTANIQEAPLVHALSKTMILNGYPDGSFRPNQSLTRAQGAVLTEGLLQYQHTPNPLTLDQVSSMISQKEKAVTLTLFHAAWESDETISYNEVESEVLSHYSESLSNDLWKKVYTDYPGNLYEPGNLTPFRFGRLEGTTRIVSQTADHLTVQFKTAADEAGYTFPLLYTYDLIKNDDHWVIDTILSSNLQHPFNRFEVESILVEAYSVDGIPPSVTIHNETKHFVYALIQSNERSFKVKVEKATGMINQEHNDIS